MLGFRYILWLLKLEDITKQIEKREIAFNDKRFSFYISLYNI